MLGSHEKTYLVPAAGREKSKLSAQQILVVDTKLISLRNYIPRVFAHKPWAISDIDFWKATELRQFLLFTGKIAMHDVSMQLYNNFLDVSVAMTILVSPSLAQQYGYYAHWLLLYFVEQAHLIYGHGFMVYNVHSLLHFSKDVRVHGSFDKISAFAFEVSK